MIEGYHLGEAVEPGELIALFDQTDWAKGRDPDDVAAMLAATPIRVTARDATGRLVGFARALCDGRYRAFLEDVVVERGLRGKGLGRALVAELMGKLEGIESVILMTEENNVAFYDHFGFARMDIPALRRK